VEFSTILKGLGKEEFLYSALIDPDRFIWEENVVA
jgi:hypothetical protein